MSCHVIKNCTGNGTSSNSSKDRDKPKVKRSLDNQITTHKAVAISQRWENVMLNRIFVKKMQVTISSNKQLKHHGEGGKGKASRSKNIGIWQKRRSVDILGKYSVDMKPL